VIRPVITSSGVYDVGRVSHFAIVDGPPLIRSGVLCLVDSTEPQSIHTPRTNGGRILVFEVVEVVVWKDRMLSGGHDRVVQRRIEAL
jgi:hypothetical protein